MCSCPPPHGHPIIPLKSNLFNMAAVSVKRSIARVCDRISTVFPVLLTIKTKVKTAPLFCYCVLLGQRLYTEVFSNLLYSPAVAGAPEFLSVAYLRLALT